MNSLTADDLRNQVTEVLAALGDTKHQIASSLFEAGRLGEPGKCGSCPIAVHLALELRLYDVAVSDMEIMIWPAYGQGSIPVDTPKPISDFVIGFDYGEFPLLVLGGEQS